MGNTLWGIADAAQLAALTKLLDDYVRDMGLVGDPAARDRLASLIMSLFNDGVKPEDMRRRLDSNRARSRPAT